MRKISRRQKKNLENINTAIYSDLQEAIITLRKTSNTKFVETVELHANLNIDPKYANQQLRTTVTLPNGNGKEIRIAVSTNLVLDVYLGNIQFDLLITTPNMMPKMAKLGRILGPKGLMPSPKSGTVTNDIKDTLTEFKKGKFEYKADKTGIVHVNFGNVNFTDEQLTENITKLYQSIEQNRPSGVKGKYFKSLFLCTSMGPSIKLDLNIFA
jgi:large subunit ribosomal protein L1